MIFCVEDDSSIRDKLLDTVLKGKSCERKVSLSGREYQIDANPVLLNDKVTGVVMLLFDVTEKLKAEQVRREFTANVSHELKTPLHSISGYAQL